MKQTKALIAVAAMMAALLVPAVSSSAQGGWEALSLLKGEKKVNCTFDYSDAIIQSKTEEQFASEEPNWGLAQKEVAAKFFEEFNERTFYMSNTIAAGEFPDAAYTLCIKPSNILRNGNFTGNVYLLDKSDNVLMEVPIRAKGGVFGSFWNLLGDGMKDAAKTIALRYRDIVR